MTTLKRLGLLLGALAILWMAGGCHSVATAEPDREAIRDAKQMTARNDPDF